MPRPPLPKLTKLETYQMARAYALRERADCENNDRGLSEYQYWTRKINELSRRIKLCQIATAPKVEAIMSNPDKETQAPAPVAAIPAGWSIKREGGSIRVFSPIPGPGGTECAPWNGTLASRLLYALCDALLQAPAVTHGWQPIDTAPFDEDLLTFKNSGRIVQDYRSRQYDNDWTHWMRLPAGPESHVSVQNTEN